MTISHVKILSPMQTTRRGVLTALFLVLFAGFAVTGGWTQDYAAHKAVEYVGRVLIVACILGRCWCTLYIGGRKGETLVSAGPYSLCRNPLYFFSFLGAAGVGAQTGSIIAALLCLAITWAVFRAVVRREEQFLLERHGQTYAAYLASTPRFLPDPAGWRGLDTVEVYPKRVVMTFLDGMMFILAIPVIEGMEALQHAGVLPVVLNLP